jgi:hypothetical protein
MRTTIMAAAMFLAAAISAGCGGSGEETPPPSSVDSGDVSEVSGDAAPDTAVDDGGGDAIADAAPTVRPHSATDIVSGGTVMKSPGFTMIGTLGQSSQHQGVTTSAGFKLRGGLVGATGSSK